MKEIIFKDNILQKESRVKIPKAIIDSMNLNEGDPVTIILDTEKEYIIIKKTREK